MQTSVSANQDSAGARGEGDVDVYEGRGREGVVCIGEIGHGDGSHKERLSGRLSNDHHSNW